MGAYPRRLWSNPVECRATPDFHLIYFLRLASAFHSHELLLTFTLLASTNSQTVINHNPIVDITHDEYFRILGPLLYSTLSPNSPGSETPRPRSPRNGAPSPPVEWFHFEGRAPQTTGENLQGLDAWHREREWRSRIVLSVELGRPPRPGQENVSPKCVSSRRKRKG